MRSSALLAAIFLSSSLAAASPATDSALDSLSRVHQFREVRVSPDGAMAAWTESSRANDAAADATTTVWVKELNDAGAAPRRVAEPARSVHGLSWSRDGRLAFVASTDSSGQTQLFVVDKPGADKSGRAKPRKVTDLQGYIASPEWSPDGRSIALLWIAGVTRIPGPTEATVADTGVVASKIDEQRLAIVNLATREVTAISPADMYVYEYDWSPDGRSLAYLASPGAGDDNWWVAEIYAIDTATGNVRKVLTPGTQVANVRWSPDGSTIAFIGGLMSDEGSTGGDIYVVPASGGAAHDLMPGRKSSPNWFRWLPSSKQILMTESLGGQMAVSTLDIASGSVESLWKGPETVTFAGDPNMSAVVRSGWTHAPEVWAGRPGDWKQVTHSNDSLHPMWGEVKSVEWKSDNFQVQGWLVLPEPYDPSKRYPMVVDVHGGPAAETRPGWPRPTLPLQTLSSQGYFVFMPNPRGSYGRGEEFTRANVKDFGHGDLRDILAGVDTVVKNYPVDDQRVGIAGWSYGGYMTMWTVTQTHRFRAAFAGAGIANWQSYYGQNSIDQWMIPYFGASVYDDPAVYAKSSPINYIKNVKTPTLVVVGERDGECPPPQSYEFWHALKTFGVKTEFVLYPGEGHSFHKPADSRDVFERLVKWFQENMPASSPAASTK
ncbi:MAG TPA: S9 family peptidase [Bryobacteraceae bacterium]|nr:S9 family peptidase [Bryobacteraceae bacterium]